MAELTALQARTVRVPLDVTTSFSGRNVDARWYTLVRAQGVDGEVGYGFCYGGSDAGNLPSIAVRELFSPHLKGRDSLDVVGIWDDLYQHSLLHGRAGSVMRALSALDIALWDLNSRAAGLPMSKMLGSSGKATVNAYASGGYYRSGKGVEQLAEEVQGYADLGFNAVKIKVGAADIGVDAERIAAARSVLGTDGLLMLDANNAWRDLPSAIRALRAWEEFNPYWIEEPFSPDDLSNHVKLANASPILVVTGEIEAGRWRHLDMLLRSAAAFLQTDAAVCGGVTEFMRIAHTADSFGVGMAPHWFHDLHVHLVGAISNGAWVEFFPGEDVLNFRKLVDTQIKVEDGGQLRIPISPGLGFEFRDDAVDQYAMEVWS